MFNTTTTLRKEPPRPRTRGPHLLLFLVVTGTLLLAGMALAEPAPANQAPLRVTGQTVDGGTRADLSLRVSQSYSSTPVRIPFTIVRGKEPGPTLCLISGIHGDELNGVAIVREILGGLSPEDIRGTIIGIPIVNLFGFWAQSRYLPDRRDLNRHFPGNPHGSTASRIAARLFQEILVHCTHAIDFHTGSLHRTNLPQVRGDLGQRSIMNLAHSFGADVLVHNPGQRGTLRRVLADRRVPTILYESGEAMRLQRDHVTAGVNGTRRVIRALGMSAKPDDEVEPAKPPQTFLQTRWIRAEHGGLLELHVGIGSDVKKGDLVGTITDPLQNSRKELRAKMDGHVIGAVMAPMVIPGLAVVHLGISAKRPDSSEAELVEVDEDRPE